MIAATQTITVDDLPGLNCGLCGMRSCQEMADRLVTQFDLLERCIHLSTDRVSASKPIMAAQVTPAAPLMTATCGDCAVNERFTVQSKLAP